MIVDECHGYRGVFGSHVGHVLRRVRRIAIHHGRARQAGPGPDGPVFLLASATISEPGSCARLLTGAAAQEVTESAAPRGQLTFGLWEPPFTASRGEAGAPVRRSATMEAARLLADLVAHDVRTLAFTRSRRGAEAVALAARRSLGDADAASGGQWGAQRVAAYRSGYLPEDRRQLEEALRAGPILGLATTTALELGINITGLDAVLIAGWPGTRAAVWQQAGRAGREGQAAVAVLIARDDPLDTYLVHHPEALLDQPVEATVLDPGNPYVLAPHLCAAAAELPLAPADLAMFGPSAAAVADTPGRPRHAAPARAAPVLDPARPGGRGRAPRHRRPPRQDRGGVDGPAGRDRRRAVRPHHGPHRRRVPASGRAVPGHAARPGAAGWRWWNTATPATPRRPGTSPAST